MNRNPPTPGQLARITEGLADILRDPKKGQRAPELAEVLAARGWPSTEDTTGIDRTPEAKPDPGPGEEKRPDPDVDEWGENVNAGEWTSVERAALGSHPFEGINVRLAQQMIAVWDAIEALRHTIAEVTVHADPEATDRPNRQAGSGYCLACEDFASGAENDRLRAGFDVKCYRAWMRAGQPERGAWIRQRKRDLAERAQAAPSGSSAGWEEPAEQAS